MKLQMTFRHKNMSSYGEGILSVPAFPHNRNVGVTLMPVSFVHKHAKLSKCKLQAYYRDHSCCARPPLHPTPPPSPAANRWTVWQQGLGGAELTDLKSVERQFLLIWLNQWRQMQPIHNSGNLWILHWALTYITMTSKHDFRGHVFSLFPLPALFLSFLCPSLNNHCMCFIPSTHPRCGKATFVLTRLIKKWL